MAKKDDVIEITDIEVSEPTGIIPRQEISFEKMMEMSTVLAESTIVPNEYKKRPENVFLALDVANRLGISPLVIMGNMAIINGRTSFSGSFIAGIIKSSPLFSDVEIIWVGEQGKDSFGCYVQAVDNRTGKVIKGSTITMDIAKKEGWTKNPKWLTISEQMLQYRAFSFFGRVHASEILTGVYDIDEMNELKVRKRTVVVNPYETKEK